MAKRDTAKVAKLSRDAYEWNADKMPSKKTKRAKVKERQVGKKEARAVDTIFIMEKDYEILADMIKNPPMPNETMKEAFKEYNKRVKK